MTARRGSSESAAEGIEGMLPLTHLSLEILMALLAGDSHGYGVIKAVRESETSGGSLRTGTFYSALRRLQEEKLVAEVEPPEGSYADERRRYYRVSELGRRVVEAEIQRLEALVRRARTVLVAAGRGA